MEICFTGIKMAETTVAMVTTVLRELLDDINHNVEETLEHRAQDFVVFLDHVLMFQDTLKNNTGFHRFLSTLDYKIREIIYCPSTCDITKIRRSVQISMARRAQKTVAVFAFDPIEISHLCPSTRAVSRRQ